MTDRITATSSAEFASAKAKDLSTRYTFALEADASGKESQRPFIASEVNGARTTTNGIVLVRLYASVPAQVYVVGSYAMDGLVSSSGQRVDEIYEVVGFSGSKSVALSKGYGVATDVSVIRSTLFFNKSGSAASVPSHSGRGLFEAGEEVYGALVVRYTAPYSLYRIEYGVPADALDKVFDQGIPFADILLPPITALAFADGGYVATTGVTRRIGSASSGGANKECGQENEIERKTKRIRTYHKDDETGEIDFDQSTDQDVLYEIISRCSTSGETRTKRFNIKLEANQVVLQ